MPRRYQTALFIVLALIYMIPFIQGVAMTVIANNVMRDLELTPYRMGVLGSSFLYAYAGSMLFSGILAAWFGPRLFLTIMFSVCAAGCFVFGLADSLAAAAVGRALCGAGSAVVMTSALTLFGRWYAAASYPKMCALLFSSGGLGTFVGTMPLSYMASAWGWRGAFVFLGFLTLAYALLIALVIRNWPDADTASRIGALPPSMERMTPALLWQSVKIISVSRDFWRLNVWFSLMSGTYLAFGGLWAVPYLKDVYGMTQTQAGAVVSMFSLGFIFGNPLLTWFFGSVVRSFRLGIGGSGVLGLLGMGAIVYWNGALPVVVLYLVFIALSMAQNAPNSICYAAARNLFGPRMAGLTGGVHGCVSYLGGGVLQILCGLILGWGERQGYAPGNAYALSFIPYFFTAVFSGIAGFTLSRRSDSPRDA